MLTDPERTLHRDSRKIVLFVHEQLEKRNEVHAQHTHIHEPDPVQQNSDFKAHASSCYLYIIVHELGPKVAQQVARLSTPAAVHLRLQAAAHSHGRVPLVERQADGSTPKPNRPSTAKVARRVAVQCIHQLQSCVDDLQDDN